MTRFFIDSDSLQKKFSFLLKEIFSICESIEKNCEALNRESIKKESEKNFYFMEEEFRPVIEEIYSKIKKYKDWKKYKLFQSSNSVDIFLINRSFISLKIVNLIFFSLLVISY